MESRSGSSKRTMKDYCRLMGTCIRVAPWVPLIGTIMIAVGLPVWAIYTRRALDATRTFADTVLGARTEAIAQLGNSVDWATLIGVVVVSSVTGVALLLSLLRSYQETARLPTNKCSAPGRLSYGGYAVLTALVNFGVWLMCISVALLIAGQLGWLLLAFVFESAFHLGVAVPAGSAPSAALYDAAKTLLNGVAANPSALADTTAPLASAADTFAAAAKQVLVTVCPVSCLNLGSFYAAFGASSSCLCAAAAQYPLLSGLTTDIWKYLVHALAALALMGLASLWLAMNLSAQFAHARRDLRDLAPAGRYAAPSHGISEDGAAVYVTTNPTYGSSGTPQKGTPSRGRDQAPRDKATAGDALLPAAPLSHLSGAPSQLAAGGGGGGVSVAPQEDFLPVVVDGAGDLQPAMVDPGVGGSGAGADADAASRGYNTTAQRYAAYRLRAAQATGKSPSKERMWQR